MADLQDLALVRQILESPWYVGLGCACTVAAWAGWRQLERQWAHQRRLELEKWRHQQRLEIEMLDHAEDPDQLRATAEALAAVRRTDPQGSGHDRGRKDFPGDRRQDPPIVHREEGRNVPDRKVAGPGPRRRWRDGRGSGNGSDD